MVSSTNGSTEVKKPFQRLPTGVVPSHYKVFLRPNLVDLIFTGNVSVELDVIQPTSELVCNAVDLKVDSVKVNGEDAIDSKINNEDELLTVKLDKPLEPGTKAVFSCKFTGELNDKMRGFYRSKYTQDGEERYAATTQFESTDARRAFPCWDEPALKATFDIQVSAPKNRVVLSNMPLIEESQDDEDPDAYRVCQFDKSPKMSTYLVAFIVGEFEAVEGKSKDGAIVRVYTPMGKTEQGKFALQTSIRSIEYYKEFFGVEYPLPKYDCIAIADFQMGAMENWGLVTFRETAVLVDPKNTSARTKQWVAIVVTHEMAHQWFGNLVTMEWWTHLWLNEGFASFMENTCTNDLFPEMDIWTQFVSDTLIPALELDALKNSHPIEVEVGHPCEVEEIFDSISYNKGASVIRMLHDYIGNDAFKQGMKHYLTTHSYKNTQTEDLWASLETASGKPVGKVMTTWTSQMGFPLIHVESRIEPGKKILTLTQEKFNADGSCSDDGYMWCVPIKILTSNNDVTEVLLENKETIVTLDNMKEDDWFKVNSGCVGYYRVHYQDEQDLNRLKPAIESNKLGEVDRLSLIDDIFALVQAGKAETTDALELIKAFKTSETSYVVWSSILNCLSKLRIIIAHDEETDTKFQAYQVDLLSKICDHVGWNAQPDEPHVTNLLRSAVLLRMGAYGHKPTVEEAKKRFNDHISGTAIIPADLRSAVYRTVAGNGGMDAFDQLTGLFRKEELHEEKERLSRSLGASKDVDVLQKVLDFAMSDEIRNQDTPWVIASVGNNMKGRDLAWQFVKANYPKIHDRYKSGALLTRLCQYTTENFATYEMAHEVENFFKENFNPAERTIRQCVENISLNAKWHAKDGNNIRNYFAAM